MMLNFCATIKMMAIIFHLTYRQMDVDYLTTMQITG